MPYKAIVGVPAGQGGIAVNDDDGGGVGGTIGAAVRIASGFAVVVGAAISWATQTGFAAPTYNALGNYTLTLSAVPTGNVFARVVPYGQEGSAFQNGPFVGAAFTVLAKRLWVPPLDPDPDPWVPQLPRT